MTDIKSKALGRLWKHACDTVVLRHPNYRVHARFVCESHIWGPTIRLVLTGLPDTRNPDVILRDNFGFNMSPAKWPGLEIARQFLVSAWVTMQSHDALEQATDKHGVRVVDPHAEYAAWGDRANGRLFDGLSDGNYRIPLGRLFGPGYDKVIAEAELNIGYRELANEQAWEAQPHWEGM